MNTMKLRSALALLALLFLTSCASLLGPRDVELPLAQIQEALSRKFPFNNRYLELFDIQVTNPRVALQPQTNRVVTTVDASVAPPFLNRSWKGSFTLSGLLSIDQGRRALVLVDPRMENFALDGLDSAYSRQVTRIGGLVAEQLFNNLTLYQFGEHEFRHAGVSFIPTRINTGAGGLVVTFEPAR
jgi:hypothetical protein